MRQAHFLPRDLPLFGEGTRARWAAQPTGGLVVFVHGFNGTAIGTWLEFPTLLGSEASCQGSDLIFYGYDGVYTRAVYSAVQFGHFLDTLLANPPAVINPTLDRSVHRPLDFRYTQLTIVAHSLGSIVTRRAVLDALITRKPWTGLVRLIFYAPAHRGTEIVALGLTALSGIPAVPGDLVGASIEFKFQVLLDLKMGSTTLVDLERDARAALERGADCVRALRVIFGNRDRIVEPGRFLEDPPPVVIDGADHMSVCKPTRTFRDPITKLTEVL